MRRTVFSLLFLVAAVLLVTAAPAGPAGSAQAQPAQPADGDCTSGYYLFGAGDICQGTVYSPTNAQDNVSLYQAAVQTDSSNNQWFTLHSNLLEQSEEAAWLRAERAVVAAAANDSTEATAEIAATEAINDYYTIHQRNLYDKHGLLATGYWTYHQDAANLSNYHMWDVDTFKQGDDSTYDGTSIDNTEVVGLVDEEITLHNGNTTNVTALRMEVTATTQDGGGSKTSTSTFTVHPGNAQNTFRATVPEAGGAGSMNGWVDFTFENVELNAPTDDYESRNFLSFNRMDFAASNIETQRSSLVSNVSTFVSATYQDLVNGQLNTSEYLSRTNKMFNYALEGGENATFHEAVVALNSMGYDTVGSNKSAYMTIEFTMSGGTNTTVKGQLLSEYAPVGGFQTGEWYNASNIKGPQMIVSTDGTEYQIPGAFKIKSVKDENGDIVSNPDLNVQDKDYRVSNTSELQDLVLELQEDINEYDDRTTDDSGAGSSGGSSSFSLGLGGIADGILSFGNSILGGLFGWTAQTLQQLIVFLILIGAGVLLLASMFN